MSDAPTISEAEWRVMKVLWSKHPSSANEIIAQLEQSTTWKAKTIKTLLNRLVNKGALGYERRGREYYYSPLISENETKRAESRSFLQRVFDGALKPALAAFIEDEELSAEDIDELKRMLDEKSKS